MAKIKSQKSDTAHRMGATAGLSSSAQPHEALLVVADRIYQRDPVLFKKLIVWVHDARKRRWSEERIFRALRALDTKLEKGETVTDWWPYLNRALEWIRTRDLEKESEGYKHQRPNSIKAILKQLLHD